MLFIEIDGLSYPMKAQVFTTQKGQEAIRIISQEAPLATNGFKIVNGNGKIISDKSDFKYLYREDENCKEYTIEAEEIFPIMAYYTKSQSKSFYESLLEQVDTINNRINALTPYEETKNVYIGDTEVRFDNIIKKGNITAYLVVNNQPYPCEVVTYEDYIIVTFDELEDIGTVTINIQ